MINTNATHFVGRSYGAAQRLAKALVSDLDFEMWLDYHPNEERALDAFARDLGLSLITEDLPPELAT